MLIPVSWFCFTLPPSLNQSISSGVTSSPVALQVNTILSPFSTKPFPVIIMPERQTYHYISNFMKCASQFRPPNTYWKQGYRFLQFSNKLFKFVILGTFSLQTFVILCLVMKYSSIPILYYETAIVYIVLDKERGIPIDACIFLISPQTYMLRERIRGASVSRF